MNSCVRQLESIERPHDNVGCVMRNRNCPPESAGIGPNRKSKTRNNRPALASGERHNPCSHRKIDMHLWASTPAIDVHTLGK
jgi:hypothetical protein